VRVGSSRAQTQILPRELGGREKISRFVEQHHVSVRRKKKRFHCNKGPPEGEKGKTINEELKRPVKWWNLGRQDREIPTRRKGKRQFNVFRGVGVQVEASWTRTARKNGGGVLDLNGEDGHAGSGLGRGRLFRSDAWGPKARKKCPKRGG